MWAVSLLEIWEGSKSFFALGNFMIGDFGKFAFRSAIAVDNNLGGLDIRRFVEALKDE